jgi:hypothetical protein
MLGRGSGRSRIGIAILALVLGQTLDDPDAVAAERSQGRRPRSEAELKTWLENMIWYHGFSMEEVAEATGMTPREVADASRRLKIEPGRRTPRKTGDPLRVLPYPGGRHPRIGFREGAIRPQRDTKFSVFTPWDEASYVVVDLPEALWSNLGLTYLAHTHVPTVWTRRGVELEPLEWEVGPEGRLRGSRKLPNGIAFEARVVPTQAAVLMELRLTNGTSAPLSDLRVQQCVMLKGAAGFARQTNENKVFRPPYAACRADGTDRWIISSWEPCVRAWGNAPCPCLHSDPQFPDCPPGEARVVRGWLSFFEGPDIEAELRRIDSTGWREALRLPGSATP